MGHHMKRSGLKSILLACGFLIAWTGASTAQTGGIFGALAAAPDGSYGFSYNYNDIDAAQDRALEECRKFGGNSCQVIRVFQNTCVAVARHLEGKDVVMNWVSGYNAEERTRRALNSCRNDGGTSCKITSEFCTGRAS